MSLPYLYAQPTTPDDWRRWAFNHAAIHYDVVAAVQAKGQPAQQYILDPMDPDELGLWLYWHQEMHSQANAALLGGGGYDLLGLDWTDPEQFAEWLRLNADEHVRWDAVTAAGTG